MHAHQILRGIELAQFVLYQLCKGLLRPLERELRIKRHVLEIQPKQPAHVLRLM